MRQNYSENYFDAGIVAAEISRAGPATTVIFFSYSWHWCGFCSVLYGMPVLADERNAFLFFPLFVVCRVCTRRLRESWPFRHIEKKGEFFWLIFGRDFLTQNISQILESLTDFCVDFLFYTDSHRFESLHICGIFTPVSNRVSQKTKSAVGRSVFWSFFLQICRQIWLVPQICLLWFLCPRSVVKSVCLSVELTKIEYIDT